MNLPFLKWRWSLGELITSLHASAKPHVLLGTAAVEELQCGRCCPVCHWCVSYFKSISCSVLLSKHKPRFLSANNDLWGIQVESCQSTKIISVYYNFFLVLVSISISNNYNVLVKLITEIGNVVSLLKRSCRGQETPAVSWVLLCYDHHQLSSAAPLSSVRRESFIFFDFPAF